jgi:hypothetical protein
VFGWVHPGVVTTIRQARPEDEPELGDIDAVTWAAGVSPGPQPSAGAAFFGGRIAPADVLVAETGRVIAGFAALGRSGLLAPCSHVPEIRGLAVHPARERCAVGRRLRRFPDRACEAIRHYLESLPGPAWAVMQDTNSRWACLLLPGSARLP